MHIPTNTVAMSSDNKNIETPQNTAINNMQTELEANLKRSGTTTTLSPVPAAPKDARFWMIFVSLLVATFLAALDLTGISHMYSSYTPLTHPSHCHSPSHHHLRSAL